MTGLRFFQLPWN